MHCAPHFHFSKLTDLTGQRTTFCFKPNYNIKEFIIFDNFYEFTELEIFFSRTETVLSTGKNLQWSWWIWAKLWQGPSIIDVNSSKGDRGGTPKKVFFNTLSLGVLKLKHCSSYFDPKACWLKTALKVCKFALKNSPKKLSQKLSKICFKLPSRKARLGQKQLSKNHQKLVLSWATRSTALKFLDTVIS